MADFLQIPPWLTHNIVQNRWLMLLAAFLILSNNGALYSFSIYSQFMKTSLNYSQQTVDTIGFFSALYIGIIPGLIHDYSGAWSVILAGTGMNVFGYLMIWLSIANKIPRPQIWQMCCYHFVAGNAGSFINTAVLAASVKNFPGRLLKGYLGLSGSLLTQIYFAIYGNHPSSYPLLSAWLTSSVFFLLMVFIRPIIPSYQHKTDQIRHEKRNLYLLLIIAVALGAYMMSVSLVQNFVKVSHMANETIAFFMVFLLLLPLVVAFWHDTPRSEIEPDHEDVEYLEIGDSELPVQARDNMINPHTPLFTNPIDTDQEQLITLCQMKKSSNLGSIFREMRSQPNRGEDYTILQALVSVDYWILFIALTCGFGAGMMMIQNLGQIGSSLGYSQLHVATAASLINIWGFVGRVGFSFASEHFMQSKGVPRPLFFAAVLTLSGIGHVVFACNFPGSFYLGSLLVGISFGAEWPLMSSIVSEIFGLKFFGTLYNVATMAQPLGSYILSVRVAGYLYDLEAKKQKALHAILPNSSLPSKIVTYIHKSGLLCAGPQCFQLSFVIMAGASMIASILSLILAERTRGYYKKQACNLY